jgi:hypothetical protein
MDGGRHRHRDGGTNGSDDAGAGATGSGDGGASVDSACTASCKTQHPSVVHPWSDYEDCLTQTCGSSCR